MKTGKQKRTKGWNFFIATGILLVFLFGYEWYSVIAHNNQKKEIKESNKTEKVFAKMNPNAAQNDKWDTMLQISDSPENEYITLTGETCSFSIENQNKYGISNWNLKINITQELYLNGFWCGDFEVHQFRNGSEIIELVKNTQTNPAKLSVEHNTFSNSVMIHLLPGDYLLYCPSETENENIVKANSEVKIGFIFYYEDALDLSDYEVSYFPDLKLRDSIYFTILVILFVMWIFGMIFIHAISLVDKRLSSEVNNSIKNISIMAELYLEVHMINLESETGYLVKGDQSNLMFNFVGCKAHESFSKYISEDCDENFKTALSNFLDISNIKNKLEKEISISVEYKSVKKGWCLIRIFKLENENRISQLIFTVQDINAEKSRIEQEKENRMQSDFTRLVRNSFLSSMVFSSEAILGDILRASSQITELIPSEEGKNLSLSIENSVEHYRLLQKTVFDMFELEAEKFQLKNENYNLYHLLDKLLIILKPFYVNKKYEFQQSIDAGIPETLEGDSTRIMQILFIILFSSLFVTTEGFVKLSVFAKRDGDTEELLFSIRDSASGFTEDQMKEVYSFLAGSRINSFDNPSLVYLKIIDGILKHMDSKLEIVSVYGSGSEFYFSIKQKIIEKA